MCIEDPFEVTHNLGKVVDLRGLKAIRFEFERAYRTLAKTGDFYLVCKEYKENEEKL
jgi:hypothetical protein